MTTSISHPPVGWPAKVAIFLALSVCTSVAARLILRTYDSASNLPVGVLALITGIVIGWVGWHRWQEVAPLRCWASIGLCSGCGGAGLVILFGHAVVYLTTPVGPIEGL